MKTLEERELYKYKLTKEFLAKCEGSIRFVDIQEKLKKHLEEEMRKYDAQDKEESNETI